MAGVRYVGMYLSDDGVDDEDEDVAEDAAYGQTRGDEDVGEATGCLLLVVVVQLFRDLHKAHGDDMAVGLSLIHI